MLSYVNFNINMKMWNSSPDRLNPYALYAAVIPACAPAISAADRAFLLLPLPRERPRPTPEPLGRPLPRPRLGVDDILPATVVKINYE